MRVDGGGEGELLFGETAVERGFISPQQLESALEAQQSDASRSLGQILVDMGRITGPQATAIEKLKTVLQRDTPSRSGVDDDNESATGLTLGGCLVLDRIATGSMGTTYRAHHMRLDRDVVVKVLHSRLVAIEGNVERFAREARAAANLEHPAIVSVYDFDESDGLHYIVMQYIKGQDLRQVLEKRGSLGTRHGLWIGARVLEGLAHAHKKQIVHRDIKPANLLITPEPRVKIADFGLVRILSSTTGEEISVFGEIIGTPQYMAPEQASGGDDFDHRVDIYSLGITLFELISGRPPFTGNSTLEVLEKQIMDPLPDVTALVDDASPEVQAFLERMCAKDKDDRFATCEEALTALQEVRRDPTRRLERPAALDPSRSVESPPIVSEQALTDLKSRLKASRQFVAFEGLVDDSFSQLEVSSTELSQAARRLEEARDDPQRKVPQLLLELLEEGLVDELLELERRVESILPTSPAVAFFLGLANQKKGNLEEARAKLALCVVLAPDHLQARLHLARLQVKLGRVSDAVATLREANRWHPSSVKAAIRLAEVLYVVQSNAEAAVPAYERAIELAPSRWQLRQQLAWILYELGRFEQAEAVLKEVLAWNGDAEAAQQLLSAVRKKRARQEAQQIPNQRKERKDAELEGPGPQTSACLKAIRLAGANNKWERALDVAEQGLAEKPHSVPLLVAKAKALVELKRLSEAVSCYGLALSADPDNEEAQAGLLATQSQRRTTRKLEKRDL